MPSAWVRKRGKRFGSSTGSVAVRRASGMRARSTGKATRSTGARGWSARWRRCGSRTSASSPPLPRRRSRQ